MDATSLGMPNALSPSLMGGFQDVSQSSPALSPQSTGQMSSHGPNASGANANGPRRPPRKSTLTQQQKNQKRQRATQDQLVTLEVEFNKNPTPTAAVRERIAQDINMTERSVQIWFQNRRAKIKLLAKKSIETGEDCDAIPESMRQYLANQALESGKPFSRDLVGRAPNAMGTYGAGGMFLGDSAQTGKIVIHHLTCKSLSVGTWRRVGQNAMDLVVFYAPDKACLTYYINNEGAGYKIEYPFSSIKNITVENSEGFDDPNGLSQRPRGILVELNRPPNFFMDSAGTGGFHQCGDFTEDQQASTVMVHHLGGHPKVLSGQLAKLVSLDSFQNRHNPFDRQAMAASAPVSPMGPPRPSSQPAHPQMAHPHLALFEQQGFGMAPPPRGHKRQRSRSVPVAVDFGAMPPMPSLHVQKPSVNMTDADNLFAPAPQHSSNHLGPMGSNLRIDTTTGYGLDYRNIPLSAATTNSPSDYASPAFFATSTSQMENIPSSTYNPSYSLPFLSPMGEPAATGLNPSISPLSAYSHGDPVITNGSPPMGDMHRSASADFLSMPQDQQDEGLLLSEMYSKQNLNLPMHSPGHTLEDSEMRFHMHEESSSEELDMSNMVHFNDMTHASLSPERSATT